VKRLLGLGALICGCFAVTAGGAASAPTATVLHIKATDGIKFDKRVLHAPAGRVTIVMKNLSPLRHNVAIKGHGVNKKGKVVAKGGTSRATTMLRKGRYEFYCSVDAHAQAGMKGTLIVT
jgi:plastocyanin